MFSKFGVSTGENGDVLFMVWQMQSKSVGWDGEGLEYW